MIHAHPYKRGFSCGADFEGLLHVWVLFWKWEWSWWGHKFVFDPDYVINSLKRTLRRREKAVEVRETYNTIIELEHVYATRDD